MSIGVSSSVASLLGQDVSFLTPHCSRWRDARRHHRHGVSKQLSHPIVGEDPGSKLTRAQKAGVPIHNEQWLLDLLKEHGAIP